MRFHQSILQPQTPVWEVQSWNAPWIEKDGVVDSKLQEMYELHMLIILKPHKRGRVLDVLNSQDILERPAPISNRHDIKALEKGLECLDLLGHFVNQ